MGKQSEATKRPEAWPHQEACQVAELLGLDHHDPTGRGSETDFEIALKAIGGSTWILKSRREFFLELSLIFGDLHDAQLMAGWRF